MPSAKWRSSLRTVRRSWGLTQGELAWLCKCESAGQVAHIEAGERSPNWRFLFACYVLFGEPIERLFGQSFAEVEEETMRRAKELFDVLTKKPSVTNRRKQALFEDALKRAIGRTQKTRLC